MDLRSEQYIEELRSQITALKAKRDADAIASNLPDGAYQRRLIEWHCNYEIALLEALIEDAMPNRKKA